MEARPDIVFASWDAEEEGLIGSTEWAEQFQNELAHAVAYFNLDVAVSGPDFIASAVPSLKGFIRDVTKLVPSPKGGMLYNVWREQKAKQPERGTRNLTGTATECSRRERCRGRGPGQWIRLQRIYPTPRDSFGGHDLQWPLRCLPLSF